LAEGPHEGTVRLPTDTSRACVGERELSSTPIAAPLGADVLVGWQHMAPYGQFKRPPEAQSGALAGSPKASLEELETAPARKL
jgi:hypothetical protein